MKIIGHRGCSESGGENTRKSVKRAIDLGSDGIEIDLRMIGNNVILLHDETVDRTTNGTGHYKSFSIKELRHLKCKNGDKIPFLEEILTIPKSFGELILEVKEPGIEKHILNFLKGQNVQGRGAKAKKIVVSSFHHLTTRNLASDLDEWDLAILYDDSFFSAIHRAKSLQARYIHAPLRDICSEHIKLAHANNLKVYAYTINDTGQYEHCLDCNVDGIFSDTPNKFVTLQ